LRRRILVHFDGAGVEIALTQQPPFLVRSYCYEPKPVHMYDYLKFPSHVYVPQSYATHNLSFSINRGLSLALKQAMRYWLLFVYLPLPSPP